MSTSNIRPKLYGQKCVVCGKSKTKLPGLKLFPFPRKDEKICAEWVSNTGYFELNHLPSTAKRYICEYHFNENSFINRLKNKLLPTAVPSQCEWIKPVAKNIRARFRTTPSLKRPKVCGNKCVVCGKSKFSYPGLKMFVFPRRDEKRCDQWVLNTGYFELRHLPMEAKRYVCEFHFTDNSFMSKLRNRLMHTAIPIKTTPVPANDKNQFNEKQADVNQFDNRLQPLSIQTNQLSQLNNLSTTHSQIELDQSQPQPSVLRTYLCSFKVPSGSEDQWHLQQEPEQYTAANLQPFDVEQNYHNVTNSIPKPNEVEYINTVFDDPCTNASYVDKQQYIPMTQPYYKRNSRPAPCKHCKRKDRTIQALRTRIKELKRITFKQRIDQLKNVSKDAKIFAKMFLTHNSHRIWSEEEKTFAIDLLAKSSSAYYFLRRRKKMVLPSQASIYTWMKERGKESIPSIAESKHPLENSVIVNSVSQNIIGTDDLAQILLDPNVNENTAPVQTEESTRSGYKLAYQIIAGEHVANNDNTYILQLDENA